MEDSLHIIALLTHQSKNYIYLVKERVKLSIIYNIFLDFKNSYGIYK